MQVPTSVGSAERDPRRGNKGTRKSHSAIKLSSLHKNDIGMDLSAFRCNHPPGTRINKLQKYQRTDGKRVTFIQEHKNGHCPPANALGFGLGGGQRWAEGEKSRESRSPYTDLLLGSSTTCSSLARNSRSRGISGWPDSAAHKGGGSAAWAAGQGSAWRGGEEKGGRREFPSRRRTGGVPPARLFPEPFSAKAARPSGPPLLRGSGGRPPGPLPPPGPHLARRGGGLTG